MVKPELRLVWLFLFLLGPQLRFSRADIGTASSYSPPYSPTACFGSDPFQFPANNLFAAAGEGIWNDSYACGLRYQVRCISGPLRHSCLPHKTIQIKIVDRAKTSRSRPSRDGSSIVLSDAAFQSIANSSAKFLNIEFKEVSDR